MSPISPVQDISSPPFIAVEGVFNIRSVGGYATSDPSLIVKPTALFRSGDPSRITEKGKNQFIALGVRRVFDFRATSEISSYKSPTPVIPGVEFIRVPVSDDNEYDPVSLALRMKQFEGNELETFLELYQEILASAGKAFEPVFRHVIENPEEPCLIHCTAGKDRTGLCTALLLMLLGVSDQDIVDDYALTTVGLQPVIPVMIERFKSITVYRDNWDGFLNMVSSRPETMAATLKMIREKYGGAEGYLKSHTSLSDEDLQTLRRNLLVKS